MRALRSGVTGTLIEHDKNPEGLGVAFWSNTDLGGKPAARSFGIPGVTGGAINHDCGSASPISGVTAGDWSSPHTGEIELTSGTYGFKLESRDSARLWVKTSW
jgi:hypothetical protein